MTVVNVDQTDFSAGELSPKVHGRFGLELYKKGLEICENFIVEPQGPARFRTGTRYVNHTRLNQLARFIPFQFNDTQAYILEFTAGYMRVFKDGGAILESEVTITSNTFGPVVVTSTAHGYSDGDEVFISGISTATDLNGKYFLVANKTANTFELTDVDGNSIAGTIAGTGGTASRIVEIIVPYLESELFEFDVDQNADTLTLTHRKHDILNITRTDHVVWTASTFSRTNDPYPARVITGITQANPGVVTSTAHGFANGDIVTIQEVVGMTESNSLSVVVANQTANTFEMTDSTGANIDTSGFTAYSSGGTAGDYPAAVGYYEGRRFYGGTKSLPETFWGSRGPDATTDGLPRYDDHTAGVDADHAVIFTLPPSFEGTVNAIEWIAGMREFLALGTFGGISKAVGNGIDEPIAPTSINVKPISDVGSAHASPVPRGSAIIYIQRGRLKIRSLEFDVISEGFTPVDRNFVSDHISVSGFKQLAFQDGDPDILWGVLNNGNFTGLTFKTSEDVSGWHKHIIGGTDVNVISAATVALPNSYDQVWIVVERTINGLTRRYVEFFEAEVEIPRRHDFVTIDANEAADDITFNNAMFEAQKWYVHLDSALTYNGSLAGSDAGATLTTASAAVATGVTFTASAAVFTSAHVGRELWKKAIDGVGQGRAVITGFTSTTVVTCTIIRAFDNTDVMAAGNWFLTTDTLPGLEHLEGESVSAVTDGSEHPSGLSVSGGSVTLDYQASSVHVGFGYVGKLQTMHLEAGGRTGSGHTKPSRVVKLNPNFFNTASARFGTDPYNLKEASFRKTSSYTNRPQPLFSDIPDNSIIFPDTWKKGKHLYVENRHPLPCILRAVDIHIEVSDE